MSETTERESLLSAHAQIEWWRLSSWCGYDLHSFNLGVMAHVDREDGYPSLSLVVLLGPLFLGVRVDV